MNRTTRAGIDLAKKVFHLTAMDADGHIVERKRLRRAGLQSYLAQLPGAAPSRWRPAAAPTTGVGWRGIRGSGRN